MTMMTMMTMLNRHRMLIAAAAGVGLVGAAACALRLRRGYDLKGKVVLITGGSRGLGLLMARAFGFEGARVGICARDRGELDRAREIIEASGVLAETFVCDIAQKEEVERMLEEVRRRMGPIDVLVNNAGIIQVGPIEVMNSDDFREAMGVYFWGPLYATLGVMPDMMRRGKGRIVNISSIGGKISVPHLLPYSAAKFALTGLSEGLRAELAGRGIAVTTVIPGLMRTGSAVNGFFKARNQQEYAWFSIADSLPVLSMNAEKAARRIVKACKAGEAEVVLTLPARVAVRFHGLFPVLTQDLLELMNRLLPTSGGIGEERASGRESRSEWSPSWITALNERAAERLNQIH